MTKIDLETVLSNCPLLHKLYINSTRDDIKNIHFNLMLQVSVKFSERFQCIHIKQKRTKIMLDPQYILWSKFKYYKIDSEREFDWFEKEKLPKSVMIVDIRNIRIDTTAIEHFERQLVLSRNLQELRLQSNLPHLPLQELTHLRTIDIDLQDPLNILTIINCKLLIKITTHNLVSIDSSSLGVTHLNYFIDKTKLAKKQQMDLDPNFQKIEQSFLQAFGLLAGPLIKNSGSKQLESAKLVTLYSHALKTTENMQEFQA